MTVSTIIRPAALTSAMCRFRSGRKAELPGRSPSSGGPGAMVPVLVLDDHWSAVRPHARLGERERRRAEGALGGDASDDPVCPPAAGTMIDLMLAVDHVI